MKSTTESTNDKLRDQVDRLEGQVKLHPKTRAYWIQLGNACKRLGNKERAIEAFQKALELKSDDTFTLNALNELQGKGLKLPTYRPTISSGGGGHETIIDSTELLKKYVLPIAIAAGLIVVLVVYKISSNLKTPDPRILLEIDKNLKNPKISPDGKLVLFVTSPSEANMDEHKYEDSFFISTLEGKDVTRIITETKETKYYSKATWLPNSSGFVVMGKEKDKDPTFFIVDISTKTATPIEMDGEVSYSSGYSLSPDGEEIAYVYYDRSEKNDYVRRLMILNINSGSSRELTNHKDIEDVAWSPDERFIAFSSSYYDIDASRSVYELRVIDIESGEETTIDETNYHARPIFFGKDDTKLVYIVDGTMFAVPVETFSGPESLLPGEYAGRVAGGLTVTPDSSIMAFCVTVGLSGGYVGGPTTGREIYLLKEGDTEPIKAENFHRAKEKPSLNPDGTWMAYETMGMSANAPFQVWVGSTPLK